MKHIILSMGNAIVQVLLSIKDIKTYHMPKTMK